MFAISSSSRTKRGEDAAPRGLGDAFGFATARRGPVSWVPARASLGRDDGEVLPVLNPKMADHLARRVLDDGVGGHIDGASEDPRAGLDLGVHGFLHEGEHGGL